MDYFGLIVFCDLETRSSYIKSILRFTLFIFWYNNSLTMFSDYYLATLQQ